jgi:hypothetical protein
VRAGHAGGVVALRSSHAGQRSDVVADGPMVASRQEGVAGELMGTTGRAPGKEGTGGAHRGRRHDEGVERSARDGGVLVEGSSGDR